MAGSQSSPWIFFQGVELRSQGHFVIQLVQAAVLFFLV